MENEVWLPVNIDDGIFEGKYMVSSLARVKSLPKEIKHPTGRIFYTKERFLVPHLLKNGYYKVSLSISGRLYDRSLHRIVAFAFIDNPDKKLEVNHKDFNRLNCIPSNLEWATRRENVMYSYNAGRLKEPPANLSPKGDKHYSHIAKTNGVIHRNTGKTRAEIFGDENHGFKKGHKIRNTATPTNAQLVINLDTGIFYETIRSAADSIGMDKSGLAKKLKGRCKNNTSMKLCDY